MGCIRTKSTHLRVSDFLIWLLYIDGFHSVPKVDFENDDNPQILDEDPTYPTSPTLRQSRLTRFLNNLGLRPNDPPYDINDNQHSNSLQSGSFVVGQPSNHSSTAMYLSSNLNPEADSFSYMETLLESMAVLGKLGNALDNIAQRLPSEIFALVETTLGEVEERAEFGRRRSTLTMNSVLGETEGAYVLSSGTLISGTSLIGMRGPLLKSSSLRLTALESLAKRVDHEILMDLFWTLYSKLEAVAQGFRVVTEVATRIGSVGCLRHYMSCILKQ